MTPTLTAPSTTNFDWQPFVQRYRAGEWRGRVFRDLVLADAARYPGPRVFADIGCGKGFDADHRPQADLATAADEYIGIEPDDAVPFPACVTRPQRCLLEDADIAPGSVHVAFAVMVLEHVPEPEPFWAKLREVLAPGGVFWGFTMDARHWFCRASAWAERLRFKDTYLGWLRGRRGEARYENYPVRYRCNTPDAVRDQARGFSRVDVVSLGREIELDYYLPRALRGAGRWLSRRTLLRGGPGSVLAVRAIK